MISPIMQLWEGQYVAQAAVVLLFAALLPGFLLVDLLLGQRTAIRLNFLERMVLSIGAGYGVWIVVALVLSYLPGGLTRGQALLGFGAVDGLLLAGWWLANHNDLRKRLRWSFNRQTVLLSVGILLLLLVAGFLRFTDLGYAEFHNDEARAALRAAAVLQGSEDVLLIHKKGPTEILVPAVLYALTGHLTETTARLPFAVANVAALLAVVVLGARLFGSAMPEWIAGFAAAALLTFDGYFIGFARIVQYQSVVFLTSVLVVLVLHRLTLDARAPWRPLLLAALLLATGLLSHYEAALVVLPGLFLLSVAFWRHPEHRRELAAGTGLALLFGAALLSLFYIPYLLHPQFTATYTYLTERRIGGAGFPYNNLADVFTRTTLYSTAYYVALMAAVTLVALWSVLRRNWPGRVGAVISMFVVLLPLLPLLRPELFVFGGRDWAVLPFALALMLPWFLPRVPWAERMVWLWFGALFLLALFFTLKPRTHVYIFFTPWALLVGWTLTRGWLALADRTSTQLATAIGAAVALGWSFIFGNYTYWYFVHNEVEILRTWDENRPAGYWTPYEQPDKQALFGFPSRNGWKVIGALYAQGEIAGRYETNELEAWGPAWYTRGQSHCKWEADWYFQTEGNLEPFYDFQRVAMEDFLSKGFEPWGVVQVNGERKMTIHQRTETPPSEVRTFELAEYEERFDALASADLPLTYPVINPVIAHPRHDNLADLFWLEGYTIEHPQPLQPGDVITLSLFWRGQQATDETHKVFIQSFYGNGTMVAQRDDYPVCGTRDTWQWDPGELITDVHQVQVEPDAPDGLYPLYVGMYLEQTGSRLDVLGETGTVTGDWVHLTDIRIGEE